MQRGGYYRSAFHDRRFRRDVFPTGQPTAAVVRWTAKRNNDRSDKSRYVIMYHVLSYTICVRYYNITCAPDGKRTIVACTTVIGWPLGWGRDAESERWRECNREKTNARRTYGATTAYPINPLPTKYRFKIYYTFNGLLSARACNPSPIGQRVRKYKVSYTDTRIVGLPVFVRGNVLSISLLIISVLNVRWILIDINIVFSGLNFWMRSRYLQRTAW
jgi:hypothetical protein